MVPGDNDDLNALRENWDRLDQSYSGVIWVSDGTIPDNSILYDGAIVGETNSGKVWRAEKQADGSYIRKWIKYPWLITATSSVATFGNDIADHAWGYTDVDPGHSVNASASDLVATRIQLPVDGVYAIKSRADWWNSTGQRSLKLCVNNSFDTVNSEIITESIASWSNVQCNYFTTRRFKAGDQICAGVWQGGPTTAVTLNLRMEVAFVGGI